MRPLIGVLMLVGAMQGQTLRPLHVSASGFIFDDLDKPVALRGLNRSGTGSGNAESNSTDAEYAAQNRLLSMNLVRIFVNAAWWNSNLPVPIANQTYQTYIDGLIQRAKKYGNYVLILKAGQFPDAPCGADGKNCPAMNQGDLNCAANSAVCPAQDTTGNNIDAAFTFWSAFAKRYAGDPAVLYDTWEDMHGIDGNTWSNGQNQLIAAIRTYAPQALIFVEDTGTAFEGIVGGTLPDLSWSNLVWNFHLYGGPSGSCTTAASTRYANWPRNVDPLVSYAQRQGHAVAFGEWGGCNDAEPYHTNITSYARTHEIALAYYDSSNLIIASGSTFQLTATGTKVAQAYTQIASSGPGTVTSVSSTNGGATLAPEAIASAYGDELASTTLQADKVPLPLTLGGTSVVVTDANNIARTAELFYVSPTQVNYQVPPGVAVGKASVAVTVDGDPAAFGNATIAAVAPGLYTANGSGQGAAAGIVFTRHADGTTATVATTVAIDLGLDTDQVTLELFGTGIRGHVGTVSARIGNTTLPVAYAGPQNTYVGLDQVNITLPKTLQGAGATTLTLTVDGQTTAPVSLTFK